MSFNLGITGHRPPRLGIGYSEEDNNLLSSFIEAALLSYPKIDYFISGMATGVDQAGAEAALRRGIPLLAIIPFEGMEAKWPPAGQDRYRRILDQADLVEIACPGGYAAKKFYERDKRVVEMSSEMIALLDGKPEKSGTRLTVQYALKRGTKVENLWTSWCRFLEEGANNERTSHSRSPGDSH